MLDRKVIYDIDAKDGLMCGRRNKNSTHKLQLGGTGIEVDHACFSNEPDGSVKLKAVNEKAMQHIRINGHLIKIINGQVLNHNDRICIGPSAMFLFKNKKLEAN
jgi:hypothetical protein